VALFQPLFYPEWVDARSVRRVACLVGELYWSANLPASARLAAPGAGGGVSRTLHPDPFAIGKKEEPLDVA